MSSLHTLQQLVLLPGHMQSVPQFLLSQSQAGQQGKSNERSAAVSRSLLRKSPPFSLLSLLTRTAGFPQPDAVSPDGFPRLSWGFHPRTALGRIGAALCAPRVPPGGRPKSCSIRGAGTSVRRERTEGLTQCLRRSSRSCLYLRYLGGVPPTSITQTCHCWSLCCLWTGIALSPQPARCKGVWALLLIPIYSSTEVPLHEPELRTETLKGLQLECSHTHTALKKYYTVGKWEVCLLSSLCQVVLSDASRNSLMYV